MIGAVFSRVLDDDEENALWRAYDTGTGKIAIVVGIEVEGTLIAGPASEESVKTQVASHAAMAGLRAGEVEVTYAVQMLDDKCGPGYHYCDTCLSQKFCCPNGKSCICIAPYCF